MFSTKILVIAVIAVAFVSLQSSALIDNAIQIDKLKEQFLPKEYRNTNFTLDELKKVLHSKCKKASGVDNTTLYAEIEKSASTLMTCLSNLANLTAIQEEIEKARPIGELDTVFHKYCQKAPQAEHCLVDFNAKIQPCLSVEEKSQNSVLLRVASRLLGFMCAKGGDQIALFVAEEGPECIEANKDAINNCMNASFYEFMPNDGSVPDLFNLPNLILEPKHCTDLERFESCTLHHLHQCQEITPANVAESLFKFVKNETNCRAFNLNKATERSILRQADDGAATAQGFGAMAVICGSILLLLIGKLLN